MLISQNVIQMPVKKILVQKGQPENALKIFIFVATKMDNSKIMYQSCPLKRKKILSFKF